MNVAVWQKQGCMLAIGTVCRAQGEKGSTATTNLFNVKWNQSGWGRQGLERQEVKWDTTNREGCGSADC